MTAEERLAAGYQPRAVKLVTNLGVFDLDELSRELKLSSVHPDVTVDDVRTATGFRLWVASCLTTTEPPAPDELRLIPEEIDPLAMRRLEFVAGKERGSLLAALIESEEAAVAELTGTAPKG